MRHTLPKSNLLRGYQSFSRVISSGTSIRGNLLTGYVTAQQSNKPTAQIGFTVSKKRVPLAVHRNRIKRLMKEAARKNFSPMTQRAQEKQLMIEIVLSYKGEKIRTAKQLTLNDLEPEWIQLRQQMLEKI